jgi:hypothetical protein
MALKETPFETLQKNHDMSWLFENHARTFVTKEEWPIHSFSIMYRVIFPHICINSKTLKIITSAHDAIKMDNVV